MTKIMYNGSYGGFRFSHEAIMLYSERMGFKLYPYVADYSNMNTPLSERSIPYDPKKNNGDLIYYYTKDNPVNENYWDDDQIERTDPVMVKIVEELGSKKASGNHASIQIRDLPAGTQYHIDEYDGYEQVMTQADYDWDTA